MTEETPAVDAPEVHAPHAHHTGHRWADLTLALAALFVSATSLWVAVQHGETMEKLVQANSMPNAEIDLGVIEDNPGSASFDINVTNSGVGPARIETIELWDGDRVIRDGGMVADAIKHHMGEKSISFTWKAESIQGTLLGAGKSSKMLSFEFNDSFASPEKLLKAAQKFETRICYCSVFNECYESDSRKAKGRPIDVDRCEAKPGAFDEALSRYIEIIDGNQDPSPSPARNPAKS